MIKQNLEKIHQTIKAFTPRHIEVIAVSKKQSLAKIAAAFSDGQTQFGENYLQEALPKIKTFPDDFVWHFIGPVQSNKTREIAENFQWVQTVDRIKIAQRLNDQRPEQLPPLNVLIQININDEESKSGLKPEEAAALAQEISKLPHLRLRGLMTIPMATQDEIIQRESFNAMHTLFQTLQQAYDIDTLSMGMTSDYLIAIEEGATMVRIGTAIFGERE